MLKTFSSKKGCRGFTLIEMTIVLIVIALLLGGTLVPLSTQMENHQRSETKKSLREIREALMGYALANGYLPCPDTDMPPDGVENRSSIDCVGGGGVDRNGVLPWVDLGIDETDAWAMRFTYGVTHAFARSGGSQFDLTTGGRIRVKDASVGRLLVDGGVAVIISHGKNRMGGIDSQGNALAVSPSRDENENSDRNNRNYISRAYSAATSSTQFDDIVVWVSANILFNRMVAAQMLP